MSPTNQIRIHCKIGYNIYSCSYFYGTALNYSSKKEKENYSKKIIIKKQFIYCEKSIKDFGNGNNMVSLY